VCVKECPSEYFYFPNQEEEFRKLICSYDVTPTDKIEAKDAVEKKKCAEWYLKSQPFEKRCIPILNDEVVNNITSTVNDMNPEKLLSSVKNIKALSQVEQIGQNVVDDLINSWWKILIGVAIAVAICIIYIVIMRWLAALMVWLSLVGVLALLIAAVYFTTRKYIELKNDPILDDTDDKNVFESYATKKDTWLVLLIISSIALAIVLLILIFLRKRILLAIALVKEGSKAVSSVTSVLFFPLFPWIFQLAVIAFTICVALYLATTGEPQYKIRGMANSTCPCSAQGYKDGMICEPEKFAQDCMTDQYNLCSNVTCKFIAMNNPVLYPYLQAFNLLAFLWGSFFVSALGQMILASVFATWYWTFRKSNLPFFAVLDATCRVLRYHIGTLAFGSLIITICRLIRIMLEYVDQKLKKYDNEITRAILCCCKCFFWCLEKFLKFINRNAYIMCAIHGKNFCASAKDAFLLLMRNIVRVFVLDKVKNSRWWFAIFTFFDRSQISYSSWESLSSRWVLVHFPICFSPPT
jgi:choline transporter-like protein 2/4/5